jgi:XXXCH domain-containing protein
MESGGAMSRKNKTHLNVDQEEAADFFAKLAESIREDKEFVPEYDIPLRNYRKIKASLKKKPEAYHLEVKVVSEDQEEPEDEDLNYKKLKKRMEAYFEEMANSLQEDYLPSREIVYVFLTDSKTMTSYSGYGDEYYEEFLQLCESLRMAFEEEDLQAMKEHHSRLIQLSDDCHARHKS